MRALLSPPPRAGSLPAAALALALLGLSPVAGGPAGAEGEQAAEEERLRRGWSFLSAEEQTEALEWLSDAVLRSGSAQALLLEGVREGLEEDPGGWPLATDPPIYDADVHAPKLKAGPRRLLSPEDGRARDVRAALLGSGVAGALRSAWSYDWSLGRPVRARGFDPLADGFENALAGYPPDLGLVRVLVLARLDRGEERRALAAFGHAYADREGTVFPGVTLFDAWNSGTKIEMPDIDALGVLHDLEDDWRSFVSPVPPRDQPRLYARLQTLFEPARRYRTLREAIADTFAVGEPVGLGVHGPNLTRFHALWDELASDPAAMAARLPDAAADQDFQAVWIRTCNADPELTARGEARRSTLASDGRAVRALLATVLEGMGAFERDSPPPPETSKPRKKERR